VQTMPVALITAASFGRKSRRSRSNAVRQPLHAAGAIDGLAILSRCGRSARLGADRGDQGVCACPDQARKERFPGSR